MAAGLLLLSSLLPLSASAHAAGESALAVDCTGIAAWYTEIVEPQDAIAQTTADPTLSLADQYASTAAGYGQIVARLQALTVPAAAATATADLIAGFRSVAESATDWAHADRTTLTFASVDAAAVALSDGQHRLATGYRERADLAAACGVGPGAAVAAGDCAAVVHWMAATVPVISSVWTMNTQFNDEAQRRREQAANGSNAVSIVALVSPWENAETEVFLQALALAVNPAPAPAAAVNRALVEHLDGWTDLYALGLLTVWAGFLGQDAAAMQAINDAYTTESTTVLTDYPKLQQQWATLATSCSSGLRLPDLPAGPDPIAANR
jgi:hypothetical protein